MRFFRKLRKRTLVTEQFLAIFDKKGAQNNAENGYFSKNRSQRCTAQIRTLNKRGCFEKKFKLNFFKICYQISKSCANSKFTLFFKGVNFLQKFSKKIFFSKIV